MLMVGQDLECSPPIDIDSVRGCNVMAVAFTANVEYLFMSGGYNSQVQVWRVKDGKQMAKLSGWGVNCLTLSKDGRWIAGNGCHKVFVWDATTYEEVFVVEVHDVTAVDFSPDSTRLVAGSFTGTVAVWDVALCKQVLEFFHDDRWLRTAKYSPQGDQIATAANHTVQVWDSKHGRLLVKIPVELSTRSVNSLLWFRNHLFVLTDNKIQEFDASTGSLVSAWPVSDANHFSLITLSQYGEFIAYSTQSTVTFWDTSTHTQLPLIQHSQGIRSIAHSPDDRFLAIGGEDGKITINSLSSIIVSVVFLWCIAHLNELYCTGIQPHYHPYATLSRNPTSRSTMLHSSRGSRNSSQTRIRY